MSSAACSRSSASCRRECRPGDAGRLLQDAAARLRLGGDDLADLALPHHGGRARAGGGVGEQELHVAGAHLLAVDAVGRARLPLDAAGDVELVGVVEGGGRGAVAIVDDAARPRPCCAPGRLPEPAKMTSSMPEARRLLCELSPITQRSASTRLDLPQPFGPTTPVRPGSIRKSVGSTKVLKPTRRRRVSFMAARRLRAPRRSGRSERRAQLPTSGARILSSSSIESAPRCIWPLMKKVGVELTSNVLRAALPHGSSRAS